MDLALTVKQLLNRSKSLAIRFACNIVSQRRIGVDHSDQPHDACLLQLLVDPGVVASEGAHANDRDVDWRVAAREILAQSLAPKRTYDALLSQFCKAMGSD
jgi:hypothetical protein